VSDQRGYEEVAEKFGLSVCQAKNLLLRHVILPIFDKDGKVTGYKFASTEQRPSRR
jgi:hypothetical protein